MPSSHETSNPELLLTLLLHSPAALVVHVRDGSKLRDGGSEEHLCLLHFSSDGLRARERTGIAWLRWIGLLGGVVGTWTSKLVRGPMRKGWVGYAEPNIGIRVGLNCRVEPSIGTRVGLQCLELGIWFGHIEMCTDGNSPRFRFHIENKHSSLIWFHKY